MGGVAGLALLALLVWFIRRRRSKDEFDGNFDPDRVVRRPGMVDLMTGAGGAEGAEVTPYVYDPHTGAGGSGGSGSDPFASGEGTPTPTPGMTMHDHPDGRSSSGLTAGLAGAGAGATAFAGRGHPNATYGPNAASYVPGPGAGIQGSVSDPSEYPVSDGSHYPGTATGSGSGNSTSGFVPTGAYAPGQGSGSGRTPFVTFPGGGFSPISSSGYAAAAAGHHQQQQQPFRNPPSSKEREAMAGRGGGLMTINPNPVVQHSDGGRVVSGEGEGGEEEEEGPREIPPSYDSIPAEERGRE